MATVGTHISTRLIEQYQNKAYSCLGIVKLTRLRFLGTNRSPSGPNLISSIYLQLLQIPLTGDKAFQSIARDKGLNIQITREKECVQSTLCLLRWGVQNVQNGEEAQRDAVEKSDASEEKGWSGTASGLGYLDPWLQVSKGSKTSEGLL